MAAGCIRVEGKTVEEAIRRAAGLLEVLPEELAVEIIDAGSQGFLGIGHRPVVIMARPAGEVTAAETGDDRGVLGAGQEDKPEPDLEAALETKPVLETGAVMEPAGEERPAYAWVEAGQVHIGGGEPPATIISGDHFELYVNGQFIAGEVAVRAGDTITVKPRVEQKDGEWKLTVASDGLTAKLTIKPRYERTWKLKDQSPASRLELKGEPVDIALPAITREELLAELNRQQVVYGVDEEAIQQACTATREMEIVVARGQSPQPPEDARVEYLFSTSEMARREVGEEERVDYREMVIRVSAAVGDLLAIKIPPQPGKPGMTVTGKAIPPPEPKDIELVAGKGTEVIDGQRCVATAEGRPQLSQRKGKVIIDIIPVLVHRGDVDLASGNIKFKGCINITGNVTETMQVIASQDVEIGGDVTQATVRAGGTIFIRHNCIGSLLVAGGINSIYQSAEPVLADLAQQLSLLQAAAGQLEQGARRQGGAAYSLNTGYLISVLVENKFKKLPSLVARLEQLTRGVEGGPEEQKLVQLGRELAQAFGTSAAIQSLNTVKLAQIAAAVEEMAAYCRQIPHDGGNITLSYALNSKIQASGWVKVTGRGCFNTEIVTGGKVEIQGVFRGGSVYAGDDVYIKEIGSSGGAKTLVRVAEGRVIKASKIWPNCTLQIGKRIRQIDNEENRVMAYLNSEGDMILGIF
ncbi:Protein of unknown function DUF342 [Moorella glycerini]|uniref:RNA-binding protein KhpB N-terminal domain-containing protein n=1 Tax=Neomoorella stamsii TaxID=1266720 RepID=A0A9X7J3F3_9FIRM|nr:MULTISPECIES: FapA family protein [Moorella]PRR72240.1 hypothetical protein MOST_19510 [Moorella stamsii]CEP69541.1 Protein of unknown function DUF342 [Moorella glycerini]